MSNPLKFKSQAKAKAAADECRSNGWKAGIRGTGPFFVDAVSVCNGFRVSYDLHDDGKFHEYSRKEVAP